MTEEEYELHFQQLAAKVVGARRPFVRFSSLDIIVHLERMWHESEDRFSGSQKKDGETP